MRRMIACAAFCVMAVSWGCATTLPLETAPGVSEEASQHNAEGIKHYKMGHWQEAKRHFEAAVQADPNLAEPHYNLALALHKMGAHEEATEHFKKAAELAPANSAITGSGVYINHVGGPKKTSGYGYPY